MVKFSKQIVKNNEKRISIKEGGKSLKAWKVAAALKKVALKEIEEFNEAREDEDRSIYGW